MSLLDAALDLAEAGYYVFPCRPRAKRPVTANGFKDASRDERTILHAWDQHPDANIGVACGATGIVVLDVDSKDGADPREVIPELGLEHYPATRTGEAPERSADRPNSLSGERGAQVFFAGEHKTTKTTIPGVELRGVGAYVVVPPSIHPSGVPYLGSLPPAAKLPPVPEAVLAILPTVEAPTAAGEAGAKIPNGQRNNTLASLAGTMRRRGMTEREILAALLVVNSDRCIPPKPESEIQAIVRSIVRYEPAEVEAATREPHDDAVRDIPSSEYIPWLAPEGCPVCGSPLREAGVTGWWCSVCPPRPGAGKKHLGGQIYTLAGLIAGHELPLSGSAYGQLREILTDEYVAKVEAGL